MAFKDMRAFMDLLEQKGLLKRIKTEVSEGYTREWPDDIDMSPEVKALVDRKWDSYGLE